MIIYEPFEEDKEFQISVCLTNYADDKDYDNELMEEMYGNF